MQVRLGYVAISKTLEGITSSSSLTYTNYQKLDTPNIRLNQIIQSNLDDLKKLIIYNIKNNIHFYRLSSNLIPLATHENVDFDYITPYLNKYSEIGNYIMKAKMRVDFHPDQFAVLNSVNPKVINGTIKILEYHYELLNAFQVDNSIILLHVGSTACGKKASITRFINNFKKLPVEISKMIALENDDKSFTVEDVLSICEKLDIPCVLDYHHYICHHEEKIENLITRVFATWKGKRPKMHFSSPKGKLKREFRSHNEFINSSDFIQFLKFLKPYQQDVDIMIEAKGKDEALFKLIRELKYLTDYHFLDETTFELR